MTNLTMRKRLTKWHKLKLWFKTLFYNSCMSWSYTMDTMVEPIFYLVDHITAYIGRLLVSLVVFLISLIVVIAHLLGIPIYWETNPVLMIGFLIPVGYWILLNLTFNFAQGVRVSPGLPSNPKLLTSTVTICKKCISPKPCRAHHCSICNRCFLKMDHHCPWLNNCVGHFNHRYFYLTMVYIVIGCVFLILCGVSIAYRQLIQDDDVLPFIYEKLESEYKPSSDSSDNIANSPQQHISISIINSILPFQNVFSYPKDNSEDIYNTKINGKAELLFGIPVSRPMVIAMIYFVALICIGTTIALGVLCVWHGKLISKGETSIEYHINNALRKSQGYKFINPYDLGRRRNWEVFLGLDQHNVSFWKHILFPSTHCPTGNGYEWSHFFKKLPFSSNL